METNQVTEHLQVIRTLMERSAIYRRALAPIMIYCGVVGVLIFSIAVATGIDSASGFLFLWGVAAFVALLGAFLLVRRQALKDSEPLWSPPTKRVAQAMFPALAVGFVVGVCVLIACSESKILSEIPNEPFTAYRTKQLIWLPAVWMALYGCALRSAGFFTPKGVRLFGSMFILLGCALLLWITIKEISSVDWWMVHLLMGLTFGLLHLAYGCYLYVTEKRETAS